MSVLNSSSPTCDQLLTQFQSLRSWPARYKALVALANTLPHGERDLNALKVADNQVLGCENRVWISAKRQGDRLCFDGVSDGRIVQGLLNLLLIFAQEQSDQQRRIDPEQAVAFLQHLGLWETLSPSKQSGLQQMMIRLQQCQQAGHAE